MLDNYQRIHLVGIGGAGMSGLARVLGQRGHMVTGSDLVETATTRALRAEGLAVHIGHRAENLGQSQLAVVSAAIPPQNPEVVAARERGTPVIKRAEALGLLSREQKTIAVAGTHGKTTTTAMIAFILQEAGLDPTIMVGSEMLNLGYSARLGRGEFLVAEADEFDGSFLQLSPWLAVVTNIEADHLDYYGSLEAVVVAFARFLRLVPPEGPRVLCGDDPRLRALAPTLPTPPVFYGLAGEAEWSAHEIELGPEGSRFTVRRCGQAVGEFRLRLPGQHNVLNALAALAAAALAGVPLEEAKEALAAFRGTRRRLEQRGTAAGVNVIDDYAHHPTEIAATLAAARRWKNPRSLWCVFQPHTYHRTKYLLRDFARALEAADGVVVTDIYMPPGREADTLGVSAADIVGAMAHPAAFYIGGLQEAAAFVVARLRPGDTLLTMGAGDVYQVAEMVLSLLARGGEPGAGVRAPSGREMAEAYEAFRRAFPGPVRADEPLARYTRYRIGGPADLFVAADRLDALCQAAALAQDLALPWVVLGGGTNILVSDRGFRGLVIWNRCRRWRLSQPSDGGARLYAEAGASLALLARETARRGLEGLEWAAGIPGTVGGGIVSNAGAYGGCVADTLRWAEVLCPDGQRRRFLPSELEMGYRTSRFRPNKGEVVLAVEFELRPAPPDMLAARMAEYAAHRRHQPTAPSAGSVFKNPPGQAAGYLIEQAGLKGHRVGGAQISPQHANFIVNLGQAQAADVLALIELARGRVRERFGVELELEILLVGEW